MKKITFLLIILSLINGVLVYGQSSITGNSSNRTVIAQEKIFIHHNTSLLLTGESFYYKVYCLNTGNNNLSDFSKVAYVEMIDKNKNLIFKHKIKLVNGLGQGDFFLPTNVSSGNYKIIAYTEWMKNGKNNNFFQSDISIINPFQGNQNEILKELDNLDIAISTLDSIREKKPPVKLLKHLTSITSDILELKIDSQHFSEREKITLNINSLRGNSSFGNYSISVRKIDLIEAPKRLTSKSYSSLFKNSTPVVINKEELILPELRGELISGKVYFSESKLPATNVKVGLSIPGNNYNFQIANTNKLGVFYFNLDVINKNSKAIVEILNSERQVYSIELNSPQPIDYSKLKFNQFKITSRAKDLILEHSVYNQIENAYSSTKSDSISNLEAISPFFSSKEETFILDDYTRFPTIKETIVEIITPVYTRSKSGKNTFHVRIYNEEIDSELLPLVLVDGNLIQDQNELIEYNPKNVNKIKVISELYVYGGQLFEGVISIETFDGNYSHNESGSFIKSFELSKPLVDKKYYRQLYNQSSNLDRIPDYRNQLLWEPSFNLNENKSVLTFYSSDNSGEYEICLEGFTKDGKPVSLREVIHIN